MLVAMMPPTARATVDARLRRRCQGPIRMPLGGVDSQYLLRRTVSAPVVRAALKSRRDCREDVRRVLSLKLHRLPCCGICGSGRRQLPTPFSRAKAVFRVEIERIVRISGVSRGHSLTGPPFRASITAPRQGRTRDSPCARRSCCATARTSTSTTCRIRSGSGAETRADSLQDFCRDSGSLRSDWWRRAWSGCPSHVQRIRIGQVR